jgi:uncharacterized membrane protein YgcG
VFQGLTKLQAAVIPYITALLSPQARPFDLAYLAVVVVLLGLLAFFVASVRPMPGEQARPPGRGGPGQPVVTPSVSPAVTPSETRVPSPTPSTGPQAPGGVPPEVARERCDKAKAARLAALYGQESGQGSSGKRAGGGSGSGGSGGSSGGGGSVLPPAPKPSGSGGILPLPSLPPPPLPTPSLSSPLPSPRLKLPTPGLKPGVPLLP